MALSIRELDPTNDARAFWGHILRHGAESGSAGELIFQPHEKPFSAPFEEFNSNCQKKWSKSLSEPGWERVWVAADDNGVFLGHLALKHYPPIATSLHRGYLMMGLERPIRGQGVGSKMMEFVIDWARDTTNLDWLDLGVLAHNAPAIALYRKFGFEQVGYSRDLFRVHGQSIDDISMTLKLR